MVLKGEGSFQSFDGKNWFYIPKSVAEDSSFPFKKGDKVTIEIEEEKLVISHILNSLAQSGDR